MKINNCQVLLRQQTGVKGYEFEKSNYGFPWGNSIAQQNHS